MPFKYLSNGRKSLAKAPGGRPLQGRQSNVEGFVSDVSKTSECKPTPLGSENHFKYLGNCNTSLAKASGGWPPQGTQSNDEGCVVDVTCFVVSQRHLVHLDL